MFESSGSPESTTAQWDSSLNEAEESELEALLVKAADKTQDEKDMEALLLEAENEEQENDDVEALLLQAEQEAAEDEFLLQAYSQNPPWF